MNYAKLVVPEENETTQPIVGREQEMVPMRGGGYGFEKDIWQRLDQFLIIGSEKNTYYASAGELTAENVEALAACCKADPDRTIGRIMEISMSGRAFKNSPAIFALAYIVRTRPGNTGPDKVRVHSMAYEAVPLVCRTGSHFHEFQTTLNTLGETWNRSRRTMTERWYTTKSADSVAYQVMKYKQRNGWSHRDSVWLANFTSDDPGINAVMRYVIKGYEGMDSDQIRSLPDIVTVSDDIKTSSMKNVIAAIEAHKWLTWEMLPSEMLRESKVWRAMIPNLPYTALMRNLARMSSNGTFDTKSVVNMVAKRLTDADYIRKSRVHPLNILNALITYKSGSGVRGKLTWHPNRVIYDALDKAFYMAFCNLESTGKNIMVALDVSSSMNVPIMDSGLTAMEAGAAIAMMIMNAEENHEIVAFSRDIQQVHFRKTDSLSSAVASLRRLTFGSTNCAAPMRYALENGINADAFIIISDMEANVGSQTVKALDAYRKLTGIDAKWIGANTVANTYGLGDPTDPGMLSTVGFDTNLHTLMVRFINNWEEGTYVEQ